MLILILILILSLLHFAANFIIALLLNRKPIAPQAKQTNGKNP